MSNDGLKFARETVEFLPLAVTNGSGAVAAYDTALVAYGSRPTSWIPATVVDGKRGLMVSGLTAGTYGIWVRVQANPETVVIGPSDSDGAGYITIT